MSYTCPECNKVFHRACNYSAHMKTHPTVEEFECNKCSKSFEFEHNYKEHMNTAHIGADSTDPKDLLALAYRNKTRNISNGKKKISYRHKCKYCTKTFNFLSVLRNHENAHLGIKAFKCKLCHNQYTTKTILKNHLLLHLEVKPFVCPKCNLRFSSKCNLLRHLRSRHPINGDTENMVRCEFCSCYYAENRVLIRHIRKEHPEKCVPRRRKKLKKIVVAKNLVGTGDYNQQVADDIKDNDVVNYERNEEERMAIGIFLHYLNLLN